MCSKCIFQPDCKALFLVFANSGLCSSLWLSRGECRVRSPNRGSFSSANKYLGAMAVALSGSFEEGMEKLLPDVLFMVAAVSCVSLVEETGGAGELL